MPSPCPSQTMWRCQTLRSPGLPQPQGHPPAPLPFPAERTSRVSPDPASARTPEQAHPHGWHSLTFPEDTVHAIQGMGITGRSERGRGQGPRLPGTAAAPPLPPAPAQTPRPPVRCCPRADRPRQRRSIPAAPSSLPPAPRRPRPAPHSLAPLSRRLLHVVLHPRRQSTAGEGGAGAPPPLQHRGPQHRVVELCCSKDQESLLLSHSR